MKRASLAVAALLMLLGLSAVAGPIEQVTKVDSDKVCMVNDASMSTEQIPVKVKGKTYYGCCAMCKARLVNDASARQAVDPVSGKKVDKARAVIGALAGGKVLYFESEKNLVAYNLGVRYAPPPKSRRDKKS